MTCKCGEVLSNTLAPNDIQLKVFTDEEWDHIINIGMIDTFDLPDPKFDVWRCPKCERLYFFEYGNDRAIKVYALEN
jgi:hypothetical protein